MFSRLVSAGAFSLLLISLSAQSAPEPMAPLPADVVDTLLRAPHSQPVDGLAAELAQRLDEAEDIISRWEKEATTGHREGATVDRATQLRGQADMIRALKEPALGRLGQERTRVVKAAASKKTGQDLGQAHSMRADRMTQGFGKLETALQTALAANPAGRAQALAKAKAVLRQLRGNQRDYELAPSATPWPTQSLAREAGPSPRKKVDGLPLYLSERKTRYLNSVASNGNIVLAVAPATAGEAGQCYAGGGVVSADLAATPDAQKDDAEIKALAEKLGYSPAKILAWVHDNIKFEPYWGSLQGAKGTLVTGVANATDHASLMIALLRASNIPARYVTGNIRVSDPVPTEPGGRVLRWLGVKTYAAAEDVLRLRGVANTLYQDGVGFDHVWVQACVPYTHYRGLALSNAGHRWIPMDASFKDISYRQNVQVDVDFDYETYLAARTDSLPSEYYVRQVEGALPADKDMADLSPEGEIKPLKLDILPANLPYAVNNFIALTGASDAEPSTLPQAHRYVLDVTLKNNASGAVLLSRSLAYPDASLKRLTLSYAPADAASQTWWNSWNGSAATLPTGGVNVKPVLRLEGVEVPGAPGGPTAMTSTNLQTLVLKLRLPDNNFGTQCKSDSGMGFEDPDTTCAGKSVNDHVKPGTYRALLLHTHQESDRYINERTAQLIGAVRANAAPTPANPAAYDATLGEFLHLSLVKYMRYAAEGRQAICDGMDMYCRSSFKAGQTYVDLKTEYLMDLPYAIRAGGPVIDLQGSKLVLVRRTKGVNNIDTSEAFKLIFYNGSALEHFIWQDMTRADAVSTVRGLQFANETGVPLETLDAANISNWDGLMDISMAPYKTQITAYVNAGAVVTVPKRVLAYVAAGNAGIWNGTAYMADAPGFMGALISGNFGGGYGAPFTTPISANYFYDPYTPSVLSDTNTSFFSYSNSTTSSLGFNSYQTTAGDPVNMVTGNFYHVERDLSIPGRGGLPLVFERSYNSRKPVNGTLGWGWTHSFNHSLRFYGVETGQAKISWIDGTGGEKFFATTSHTSGNITINTTMLNSPGIFVVFKREANGQYTVREKNGLTYIFESVNGGATNTGLKAKLLSIKDRNNNTLSATYSDSLLSEISDGVGRKLSFTYTGGLLTKLEFKKAGGAVVRSHEYEPPRIWWRLQLLRRWSHEEVSKVFP